MRRLAALVRPVRRAVLARRRLLAALLTAVAVATGLHAATAPPPAEVRVLVAAHDLPSGAVLGPDDLRRVGFAPGSVPAGAVPDAAGRTLAAPLRAGEPVTDVRLVGPSLTDGYPGLASCRAPEFSVAPEDSDSVRWLQAVYGQGLPLPPDPLPDWPTWTAA